MMQTRHYLHWDSRFPGQDLSGEGPAFQQHWMMMAKAMMFSSCVLMLPSVLTQCFCLDSKDKGPDWDVLCFHVNPPKSCVRKLVVFGFGWCKCQAVSPGQAERAAYFPHPSLAPRRIAALWFWRGVVSVGRSPPRSFSGLTLVRAKCSQHKARKGERNYEIYQHRVAWAIVKCCANPRSPGLPLINSILGLHYFCFDNSVAAS